MNHAAKNRASLSEGTPELEQALRQLRRESRIFIARAVSCALCWLLAIALFGISISVSYSGVIGISLLLSLICLVLGAILIPSAQSSALEELAKQQDTRAVGPLLDSLDVSWGTKTEAIQSLLISLLPRLSLDDASLLSRSHRSILWNALEVENADVTLDYLLAVLAALEQVGNEETAQRLRGLVKRGAVTGRQRHIRKAAEKCLIALEVRLAQEQVSGTLLRPAAPSQSAAELLHPVATIPDAHPETLLQPANRSTD